MTFTRRLPNRINNDQGLLFKIDSNMQYASTVLDGRYNFGDKDVYMSLFINPVENIGNQSFISTPAGFGAQIVLQFRGGSILRLRLRKVNGELLQQDYNLIEINTSGSNKYMFIEAGRNGEASTTNNLASSLRLRVNGRDLTPVATSESFTDSNFDLSGIEFIIGTTADTGGSAKSFISNIIIANSWPGENDLTYSKVSLSTGMHETILNHWTFTQNSYFKIEDQAFIDAHPEFSIGDILAFDAVEQYNYAKPFTTVLPFSISSGLIDFPNNTYEVTAASEGFSLTKNVTATFSRILLSITINSALDNDANIAFVENAYIGLGTLAIVDGQLVGEEQIFEIETLYYNNTLARCQLLSTELVTEGQFTINYLELTTKLKPKHAKLVNFTDAEVGAENKQSSEIYSTKTKNRINPIGIRYNVQGGNRVLDMTTTHGWTSTSNFSWIGAFKLFASAAGVSSVIGYGRNVGGLRLTVGYSSGTLSYINLSTSGEIIVEISIGVDFLEGEFLLGDILKYSVTFDSASPLLRIRILNTRTNKEYEFSDTTYTAISFSNQNSLFIGGQISGPKGENLINIEAAVYKDNILNDNQIDEYFITNEFPQDGSIFGGWYLSDSNYLSGIKEVTGTGIDMVGISNNNGLIEGTSDEILVNQLLVDSGLPVIKEALNWSNANQINIPLDSLDSVGFNEVTFELTFEMGEFSGNQELFEAIYGINSTKIYTWIQNSTQDSVFQVTENGTFNRKIVTDGGLSKPLVHCTCVLDINRESLNITSLKRAGSTSFTGITDLNIQNLSTFRIRGKDIKWITFAVYQKEYRFKDHMKSFNNSLLNNVKDKCLLYYDFGRSSFYENGIDVYIKDYSGNSKDGIVTGFPGAASIEQLANIKLNTINIDKYVRNHSLNYLTQFGKIEADHVIYSNETIKTIL